MATLPFRRAVQMGTEVTRNQSAGPAVPQNATGWGRRALFVTVIFVLAATLFPFQFLPQETAYRRIHPFLLWLITGAPSLGDFLENVIFFIPLGFSLACWSGKKGFRHLAWAWAAGAALSILVEFLQVFLPTRGSEWWDVIANSVGSALGFLIFEWMGVETVRFALRMEAKIERVFTPCRIAITFAIYCGLMFFCSATLQQSTNLTYWAPSDMLLVGNNATQRRPWQGRILQVVIADKAMPPEGLQKEADTQDGDYVRSASVSPNLLLDLSANDRANPDSLRVTVPAKDLIRDLHRTNQFTLQVLWVPGEAAEKSVGTLVSLAHGPRHADLVLGEYGGRWLAGIRSALAGETRRWDLVFSNIPKASEQQEITVSFDGSKLSAFVDGKRAGQPLRLNPGATLASAFKGVGARNVYGYGILYEGLVCMPLGFLLALARRNPTTRTHRQPILRATPFFLPPLLLELVISLVSSHPFNVGNVILGVCMILGALLLLNCGLSDTPHPWPQRLNDS
jgi:glycopeptide antibiotics resistance protein